MGRKKYNIASSDCLIKDVRIAITIADNWRNKGSYWAQCKVVHSQVKYTRKLLLSSFLYRLASAQIKDRLKQGN